MPVWSPVSASSALPLSKALSLSFPLSLHAPCPILPIVPIRKKTQDLDGDARSPIGLNSPFFDAHFGASGRRVDPRSTALDRRACSDFRCMATANESGSQSDSVVPGVIVGAGRVGQALFRLGGGKDVVVRRGEAVPEDSTGPIFVCTRNDALESVVASTPPHRRKDLVFLQNGMIEPWIESKGLRDATQVLVYFAVAKAGDDPIDGKTDVNPEGLTAAHGPWADAVAKRLHSYNLSCKVLDAVEFKKSMLEKLIWISAFMLVGAKHEGITVGDVESKYRSEVDILIDELASVSESEKGIQFDDGLEERLSAYARSVSHFPTAIKEFEWRNGWFYSLSKRALENGQPDPTPTHTLWLKQVKAI